VELTEKKVNSRLIFDGKVVHLYVDDITLPDGKPATREHIKHVGAVCVVPLTDKDEVICVKQYRYPFSQVLLEIPAGKLDSYDEDPVEAALRELREETGAVCESLVSIGQYYPSPAILGERIHMFLARGLSFGKTDFDEDEFLEIVKIPLSELYERVLDGKIRDGKTQTAILKTVGLLQREAKGEVLL